MADQAASLANTVKAKMKMEKKEDAEELVDNEEVPEDSRPDADVGEVQVEVQERKHDVPGVTTTESTSDPGALSVTSSQMKPVLTNNQNKVTTAPVTYSTNGQQKISQADCVVTRADGTRVVISPSLESNPAHMREIAENDIRFLRIFSVISLVLFFPLGIPAFYFFLKAKKEFPRAKQINDMTLCRKLVKKCERFIIFSLIAGLLTFALVFAIVERTVWKNHEHYVHYGMAHHGIG